MSLTQCTIEFSLPTIVTNLATFFPTPIIAVAIPDYFDDTLRRIVNWHADAPTPDGKADPATESEERCWQYAFNDAIVVGTVEITISAIVAAIVITTTNPSKQRQQRPTLGNLAPVEKTRVNAELVDTTKWTSCHRRKPDDPLIKFKRE